MTDPEGGLRDRLVFESFIRKIKTGLAALGWLDPDRHHIPLTVTSTRIDDSTSVALNTIAISAEDISGDDAEVGSGLSEDSHTFYVDMYAENDALGEHVAGDIRDLLRGKLPSIGVTDAVLLVKDWTVADDSLAPDLFWADIEEVNLQRAHGFSAPFQRHWFSVSCQVIETRP